jgi:uncharacterized protein with HEPN domain
MLEKEFKYFKIIGEAANRLPQNFKTQHSGIEWPKIIGLRHRIVHDYFNIDVEIVWQIIQEDLPAFKSKPTICSPPLGIWRRGLVSAAPTL